MELVFWKDTSRAPKKKKQWKACQKRRQPNTQQKDYTYLHWTLSASSSFESLQIEFEKILLTINDELLLLLRVLDAWFVCVCLSVCEIDHRRCNCWPSSFLRSSARVELCSILDSIWFDSVLRVIVIPSVIIHVVYDWFIWFFFLYRNQYFFVVEQWYQALFPTYSLHAVSIISDSSLSNAPFEAKHRLSHGIQ